MTIAQLHSSTPPVEAAFEAQITTLDRRTTKGGSKPFLDLVFADGTAELKIKVWSDSPSFHSIDKLEKGAFVAVRGNFAKSDFGWESRDFTVRELSADEVTLLLEGGTERRDFLEARWQRLGELVSSLADSALRKVTTHLLGSHEEKFRRAAAARGNHHARRGGLVEHVTEMAETADAICRVYPHLNRSLLIAAVVFHDVGKIWENQYEAHGFNMPFSKAGSLLGHIPLGFAFVQSLWVEVGLDHKDERLLFLRHLILSHHGELAWGSPLEPACPEAAALHYIDQISAKLEMLKGNYQQPEVAPGLHDKGYPLKVCAAVTPRELALP